MACFLAPAAEAVAVTVAKKVIEKKEQSQMSTSGDNIKEINASDIENKIPFSRKLSWLMNLLWGGSFLLLIEHIWHGEVVLWPPFLTAMGSAEDTAEMLNELATAGVAMAAIITFVWVVMIVAVKAKEKSFQKENIADDKLS